MSRSRDDTEIEPLLRPSVSLSFQTKWNWCPKRLNFIPARGSLLVLFWTLLVGMVYKTITAGSVLAVHTYLHTNQSGKNEDTCISEVITVTIIHFILIVALLFYPIAGFIADIYVGRYRTVVCSLFLLLCGCVSFSIASTLYFVDVIEANYTVVTKGLKVFAAFMIIGYLLTFIGFPGYQSNYIQLGLDQLQDAPSYSIGLFVHFVEWFMIIGMMLVQFVISWSTCSYEHHVIHIFVSLPFLFILMLVMLIFVGWWKRRWFHAEPARHNPYGTLLRVINFARKHKYPVQYCAFGDGEEPSRLDYAMNSYGGPFTREQVEDVKSFLNIIMVLLSIGPIFVLVVPAGLMYANFVQHVTHPDRTNTSCNWKWIFLDNGGLKYLVATVFYPIYIWFIYSALRYRTPRIFTRLFVWIVILLFSVASMVIIDLVGHLLYHHQNHIGMTCLFTDNYDMFNGGQSSTLNLPWAVVVLPSTLQAVAPMMVITTVFEFISAQTPYSMKGFLVGVFFAVMGLFQFIGSLMLLPFNLPRIWQDERKNAPIVNCGFGYLLSLCAIGLIGLVSFSVAAKLYRYRERK